MTDSAATPFVVDVDGVPMSGLTAGPRDPRAVLVAVHGGATTAAYFDCPGHPRWSLVRTAAALGYTVVALDRPGYGSSAPFAERMQHPHQRVELAYGALDAVLGDSGRGAGVFLLGHSAGCELAVRLAADERAATAGVFGLAMSGTGLRYTERAGEILKKATVTLRPVGLRELLWQPAHLYPPEVFAAVGKTPSGARYEADVTRKWPVQDFPALAPQVRVPVLFSVAEHERIWRSDPRSLADIAALFTASPRFELDEQPGAGHNLSLSVYAAAYHLKVLSFLEECAVTRECSTTELEAG